MSPIMFENILKELSNLISENDLHVSQVSHCMCMSNFVLAHPVKHFWDTKKF